MRVLHVSAYFAPAFSYGGPPRSILGLCKGLQRTGVDVEVYTTTANGRCDLAASPAEGDRFEGVPVRYFPRRFPRRFYGTTGLAEALGSSLRRFDLLHIHGLWNLPAWQAARAARRAGRPYILSPRGMLNPAALRFRSWRKRLLYRLVEHRNLAGARALHATSDDEAAALRACGTAAEVFTLANGVDLGPAQAVSPGAFRRTSGLPDDAFLIVFLGRIHAIKRLDLLADAFLQLRADRPQVHLVLAGPREQEGYCQELERRLAPAADAVHWTGQVDQDRKWALLTDADAVVMCSDAESFGLSTVEALAAGVPVVATRTCPWSELETHACGFWVEHSAADIARALERLLADRSAARAMGQRGREFVRSRYGWDSIAQDMAERYRQALSGDPRGGR